MLGNTHDSVMGYTFRHILLDFLCGYISAQVADSRFEGFRERYPDEAYYCMMNLVSSHDVPRIMTMLSRPEDTDDRDIQREFKVDASTTTVRISCQDGFRVPDMLYRSIMHLLW